jgi:hypothetical protein
MGGQSFPGDRNRQTLFVTPIVVAAAPQSTSHARVLRGSAFVDARFLIWQRDKVLSVTDATTVQQVIIALLTN